MTEDLMRLMMMEWCEARAQYDYENFPGGYPYYRTAHRLYHAGRALYDATGVEASEGTYKVNPYFEKPSAQCQELLARTTVKIRNYGTDLPSGMSCGYYFGKKLVKDAEDDQDGDEGDAPSGTERQDAGERIDETSQWVLNIKEWIHS